MSVEPSQSLMGIELAGRYRLSEVLAQGSICQVLRGEDEVLRRPVAVKVAPGAERVAYLEALRATGALNHPAVVAMYDVIEQDGQLFLVYEYVPAQPLSHYVAQGLPAERVVSLGLQIGRLLDYAHRRQITHGDLTPTAILIDRHANVRVSNFCLPTDEDYFAHWTSAARRDLLAEEDATAQVPALAGDGDVAAFDESPPGTPAADVRATGLLLWQLLSMAARASLPLEVAGHPARRRFRPDVPEQLRQVVRRCLAAEHAAAISAAEHLVLALEGVAEEFAAHRPQPLVQPPPTVLVARAAMARAAAWSVQDTVIGGATAGTEVLDPAATRAASDLTPLGGPMRLTLPSRPIGADRRYAQHQAPSWDAADPHGLEDELPPVAQDGDGMRLVPLLVIGAVLFIIFFVIGMVASPLLPGVR